MARYTGWRRLSGDTADRPDLLDLGKRLLGELDTQRRISGVKTLTMERQAPDGSTVRVGFIYEQPFIEVQAASNPPLNARRAIALRMVSYLFAPSNRFIPAVIELDYFDEETFELVGRPRKVLAWQDWGTIIPRTEKMLAIPSAQPYVDDAAWHPEYLIRTTNNVVSLNTTKFAPVAGITNPFWNSLIDVSYVPGSETYECVIYCASTRKIIALGAARYFVTSVLRVTDTLIFAIDVDAQVAVIGRIFGEVLGLFDSNGDPISPAVDCFQPSAATGHAYCFYAAAGVATLYRIADSLVVAQSRSFSAFGGTRGLAQNRDGSRLFAYITLANDGTTTLFALDPTSLATLNSTTLVRVDAWARSFKTPIVCGRRSLYVLAQDGANVVLQVRDQATLALERQIVVDGLAANFTSRPVEIVLGPGEKRIYAYDAGSLIAVLDAGTGAVIETILASALSSDIPYPVSVFNNQDSFLTGCSLGVTNNLYLAR